MERRSPRNSLPDRGIQDCPPQVPHPGDPATVFAGIRPVALSCVSLAWADIAAPAAAPLVVYVPCAHITWAGFQRKFVEGRYGSYDAGVGRGWLIIHEIMHSLRSAHSSEIGSVMAATDSAWSRLVRESPRRSSCGQDGCKDGAGLRAGAS